MKKLILSLTLLLVVSVSFAIPAYRRIVLLPQADGTTVEAIVSGDEYGVVYTSLKTGKVLKRSVSALTRTSATSDRTSISASSVKTTGDCRYPVVLIEFADKKFSNLYLQSDGKYESDSALYHDYFNGDNFKFQYHAASVRKYFIDQSYNKYRPSFDIIGKITLSSNYSTSAWSHIRNAINVAYQQGRITDEMIQQWDNDNDGNVDGVLAIFPGIGQSYTRKETDIWAHTSSITSLKFGSNPTFSRYACATELYYENNLIDGIGVIAHEFGHILGLPDLYDTNNTTGEKAVYGMDVYSAMDQGAYNNGSRLPAAYTSIERHLLGWLDFEEIKLEENDSIGIELTNLSSTQKAYIYYNPNNTDEAIIFESHNRSGWDRYFASCNIAAARGMLIIHIEMNPGWKSIKSNNNYLRPGCTLIPADGELLPYNYQAYTGDAEAGKRYSISMRNDIWPSKALSQVKLSTGEPHKGPFTTLQEPAFYTGGNAKFIVENIDEDFTNDLITFSIKHSDYKAPTTSIDAIDITEGGNSRLQMQNGRLVIVRGKNLYNLNGQQL